jgi:S-(hydroxymethyl)glutathione dehydrogenase/alcohol dehydrogenase
MRTRAAVLEAKAGPLKVQDLELAAPGAHDVVVRVMASGVCHTDKHIMAGAMPIALPMVLGHEGAGSVEEVGSSVRHVKAGDTVVLISAPPCGQCWFCVRGETSNCDNATRIRSVPRFRHGNGSGFSGYGGLGTFSEYLTLDATSVVPVETKLPWEQLALLGCGVVTGVGAVLNSVVRAGSSVVVVGCGGVGLSAIQGARIAGASEIIAVDPVLMKREAARAAGATTVVDPTTEDLAEVARERTGGRGVDAAFEAVGSSRLTVDAMRATRLGGITYVIGVAEPTDLLNISALELLMGRKTLAASIFGNGDPRRLLPQLVRFAETGVLDLASMVTRTISLDSVNDAFDSMDRGDAIRSVIRF